MQKYSTAGREVALPRRKAKKFVIDVSATTKTTTKHADTQYETVDNGTSVKRGE